MGIELVKKYAPATDELFAAESKKSILTNTDYDWTGAHSVLVYKISTVAMNDYARNRFEESVIGGDNPDQNNASVQAISRYGQLCDLNAQTEEMLLKKDRSFIFNVDKLDQDETGEAIGADTALARQLREVVIPEVDTYTYNVMVNGAGTKAAAVELTKENIYTQILTGTEVLDDEEVPETERVLAVTPATYTILKQAVEFDHTDIGAEMRLKGVVGMLDGMMVVKIPSSRLPEGFGFMIAHPSATTAPVKLEDFGTHEDTPLSSGTIVTGRIVYDAFVLDNKKKGIYYHPVA